MADGKVWGKKKIAVGFATLLILCVVIAAAVLIINKVREEDGDGEELVSICPLNTLDETATCIEEIYAESGDVERFIGMYDRVIVDAEEGNNYDLASKLVIQRATSLVNYGYCSRALGILDAEDFDGYNAGVLAYIYSRAASISLECENDEARKKWTDLMMETQKELHYEAF